MRETPVLFVVIKESAFPAIKKTVQLATAVMATQENHAVSMLTSNLRKQ